MFKNFRIKMLRKKIVNDNLMIKYWDGDLCMAAECHNELWMLRSLNTLNTWKNSKEKHEKKLVKLIDG